MKVNIHPPLCFHELGQRANNEDNIFPEKNQSTDLSNNLFIVCDGVGGAEKGEVASKIVCNVLSDELKEKTFIGVEEISKAIEVAEDSFDSYIKNHVEADGMATTLAMIVINSKGVTTAHIGDSRVYQIRGNEIVFKTSDHSLVNEMVSENLISEQEAQIHPKRNVVTKAIVGGYRRQRADFQEIEDVAIGDYFFICSDGVLESVSDPDLISILANPSTDNQGKMNKITEICSQISKDNFSAYLIQINEIAESDSSLEESKDSNNQTKKSSSFFGLK